MFSVQSLYMKSLYNTQLLYCLISLRFKKEIKLQNEKEREMIDYIQ